MPEPDLFQNSATDLPNASGAYLLRIVLAKPRLLPRPLPSAMLEAGVYLYAGSARGPGGIRARCARHLRRDKTLRWHVDRLTTAADSVSAAAFPGASECDLVEAVLARGATVPVAGFGSSDCRRCRAHLLRITD